MIRSATTTAMLALFSLMANGAWAHDYYPEPRFSWSKDGSNCVVRFFVKKAPENNAWEWGRYIHNIGLNWCIAKQHIKKDWVKKNGEIGHDVCVNVPDSPRYGGLGHTYAKKKDTYQRKTNKFWKISVPYEDIKLDPNYEYSDGKTARFILSVNFYTGYTHHHHSGSHTFSQRIDKGC